MTHGHQSKIGVGLVISTDNEYIIRNANKQLVTAKITKEDCETWLKMQTEGGTCKKNHPSTVMEAAADQLENMI